MASALKFNEKISQNSNEIYFTDAAVTDAYVITLVPAVAAYVTGQVFNFKANTANTGGATLNVNGLGAIAILKHNNVVLADNDIESGQIVTVVYDGANFQMLSPVANAPGFAAATQAEQETGTSIAVAVTPGRQQFHKSAAKFWIKATFTGASVADTVSYNVTSITYTSVGRVQITIDDDFSSADWCVLATTGDNVGTGNPTHADQDTGTAMAAGTVDIAVLNHGAALENPDILYVAGYGDLA